MQTSSYRLGPGWAPNPVYDTACAFMEAARSELLREANRTGWADVQNWFVAHHLSVIATELFLKSFQVTFTHGPVTSPDGPEYEKVDAAFTGHRAKPSSLPNEVNDRLKAFLPAPMYDLLVSLNKEDLQMGRYPYEEKEGQNESKFPEGDSGKRLAVSWFNLACALSKFGKFENLEITDLFKLPQ